MNHIKKYLSIALLGLVTVPVFADTVTVENVGTGPSIQEAIDIAVRRSIEQVKGVSVESQRSTDSSYARDSNSGSNYSQQSKSGETVTTAGRATYRILSEKCSAGECRVRLQVNVSVPKGYERQQKLKQLNSERRTIAVKPFTGSHAATITRELEANFVKDRKFNVLTDLDSPNLDYVLEGRVIEAQTRKNVTDKSRTVALTGEYIEDITTTYSSRVLLEYKLIDRVNEQIKWSATIPTTSSRNNLSLLLNISANKVFDQLKENIYPYVLIKNDDNSLVLNSGSDNVRSGQHFDIFKMGEAIIDPVTKESLGVNEIKVARVKASRILPKLTYVTLVSGSVDDVGKHAIARKIVAPAPARSAVSKPKSNAQPKAETKAPTRVHF
ncbi:hypothetical protein [Vibrio maerlii]|uniref:hypothetical protein n=1 Tax=Vibrio maerlii TaxID=2231648 RepID=UPI000E3CC76F|nr:hypothetical protein [Vibrio maerlii]